MTTTTRQRATYGDFVTLPSAPGIIWRVTDARTVDKAGDPNETRAELKPWHPGPDAENPAEGAYPYLFNEPVKIGQASRPNVYVGLAMVYPYDRVTDTYGPTRTLKAHPRTGTFDDHLTEAQRKAISADCEDAFAVSFVLPPLTAAEIREKVSAKVPDMHRVAMTAAASVPGWGTVAITSGHNDDDVRAEIREAFGNLDGQVVLENMLNEATRAFRAAYGAELAKFGAISGGRLS
jgi:hypothetical protein